MRGFIKHKQFNAFTLAEVLVTLGIIGVVSAMTIPTLMQNHQRTVYVTQLHKVYNETSQAMEMTITDSNAVSLRESKLRRNGIENFLKTYFKTTKTCDTNNLTDCLADTYTNMNGTTIRVRNSISVGGYCADIPSGAVVCLSDTGMYTVLTDVNGKAGPNILGRDLFSFKFDDSGSLYTGDMDTVVANFSQSCTNASEDSYGYCFAKIVNDGWKMDY